MTWWQYLILANVYLILFYGFYALLLRRETFFQLNRLYLVGSAVLSFMVPLMQAGWARNLFITQQIKQTIYHLDPVVIYQIPAAPSQHLTIGQVLAIIYVGGIILLASRFILQLMVLRYNIKYNDSDDAYSFFKTIKLGETLNNRGVIMAHEEVHAQQWHSADVLLIESIMIINWFNPAVYFYRKAIKHIHEFIADRNALKSGTSKQQYALLLLSETFKTPAHELVNPFFNHSLLKQRILMLQKNNSQRTALLKYGLSAPLFALMLILSSATINTNKVITIISDKAERVMMVPASPQLRNVYASVTTSSDGNNITTTINTKPQVQEFKPLAKPVPIIIDKPLDTAKNSALFTAVENPPSFKGGVSALGSYLSQNIRYPEDMRRQNLQARVIVAFVVEADGSLSHVRALNGRNTSAATEAIRVIAASPKWVPGVQNGKKVRVEYTVPIDFTLQPDAQEKHVAVADTFPKHTFNKLIYTYQYKNNNPAGVSSSATIARTGPDSGRVISNTYYRAPQYAPLIVTTTPRNLPQPLYIIDGEEASPNALKSTAPANIESVTVLKGTNATQQYGKKGENGVVLIVLKKPEIKN
jgi:TonB family protein